MVLGGGIRFKSLQELLDGRYILSHISPIPQPRDFGKELGCRAALPHRTTLQDIILS